MSFERLGPVAASARIDRRTVLKAALMLGLTTSGALAFLEACQGSTSSTGPGDHAGFFFDALADEWYIDEVSGAKAGADALGFSLQNYTFGSDPSGQVGEVQDAVTSKVNLMAIYAPLGQGVKQFVQVAEQGNAYFDLEADIASWTYPGTYGKRFSNFITNNASPGAADAGRKVLNMIGGKGNVVWMTAIPGGQDNQASELGFAEALAEFPDVKVVAKGPGKYSREPAFNLMADWLTKFPKIDALFSHADTQSLGAYQAMQQAKRTDIKIASINGQLEGLQAVKNGQITVTVFKAPIQLGAWRMVHLYDVAHGWTPGPLERMYWLDSPAVDQSTVDKYLNLVQSKPLPYDWKKMSRVLHPNDWETQMPIHPINPVEFWKARNLGVPEPSGWLPADVQKAIDNGEFEQITALYRAHLGKTPV